MHLLNNSKVYGYEISGLGIGSRLKVWRLDDLNKIIYLRCGSSLSDQYVSFYQKDGVKLTVDIEDGKAVMSWKKLDPHPTKCIKCGGTGTFRWSVHHGQCNHCQGKGHQTLADKVRNANYIPKVFK